MKLFVMQFGRIQFSVLSERRQKPEVPTHCIHSYSNLSFKIVFSAKAYL
jgi:hypothetical protein